MIILSPRLFVAAANAFIGVSEEAGARRGHLVELFLHEVHEPTDADWSAAFVHHVGFWSHFDHMGGASTWPLPAVGNCNELAKYAEERSVLLDDDSPAHGDIYVQWSPARRAYVRAGIVIAKLGAGGRFTNGQPFIECSVIEGNSGPAGMIGGPSVVRIVRKLAMAAKDRVIRWTSLDARLALADPMQSFERVAGRAVIGPQRSGRRAA